MNADAIKRIHVANGSAAKDDKPVEEPTKPPGKSFADCYALLKSRKSLPWVPLFIGKIQIATLRAGSFAALIAPSGAGKSSLVLQMLTDHATNRGPAVYLTHELDGDEAAGRINGQHAGFSWDAALRDEVPPALIPELPRLWMLDRDDAAAPGSLDAVVAHLRGAYPGEPILVGFDYLQAMPAPMGQQRSHVAATSTGLRHDAKRLAIVIIGVSQMSNANSIMSRKGDKLGADAADTGAETAQIQRDSYLILALGDEQITEAGLRSWKLSIAKQRIGAGDMIVPVTYTGRVGSWEVTGEIRPASLVKAERADESTNAQVETFKLAIRQLLGAATEPLTRSGVESRVKGNGKLKQRAMDELLDHEGDTYVEIAVRGRGKPMWTRAKAEAAGLTIRPRLF